MGYTTDDLVVMIREAYKTNKAFYICDNKLEFKVSSKWFEILCLYVFLFFTIAVAVHNIYSYGYDKEIFFSVLWLAIVFLFIYNRAPTTTFTEFLFEHLEMFSSKRMFVIDGNCLYFFYTFCGRSFCSFKIVLDSITEVSWSMGQSDTGGIWIKNGEQEKNYFSIDNNLKRKECHKLGIAFVIFLMHNGLQLKSTTKNHWEKVTCADHICFQEKESISIGNYNKDGEIKLRLNKFPVLHMLFAFCLIAKFLNSLSPLYFFAFCVMCKYSFFAAVSFIIECVYGIPILSICVVGAHGFFIAKSQGKVLEIIVALLSSKIIICTKAFPQVVFYYQLPGFRYKFLNATTKDIVAVTREKMTVLNRKREIEKGEYEEVTFTYTYSDDIPDFFCLWSEVVPWEASHRDEDISFYRALKIKLRNCRS
ncbi:hypothetical protein [Candidatus Uabimicrobium sp. HlEnr_7]|uniref:hypothetical protein n=1 Tax=Candidatus Uabimicrobium helgolandensis TaxID=3095367 RepID=UPI0035587FF8